MDFRVFVVIEAPILDQKYELFVPVDRRIHDLISILKKTLPELSKDYYLNNIPNIYNKSTGKIYDMNLIIKNTDIKMGTRLILL
jgi:hypothetical protein